MMKLCTCIAYFCIILLSTLRCSNLTQVSGIEITNGNCIGKIYDSDGAVADSALVRLIPSDYNPYSQTNKSIDSTYTNAHGEYAFTVAQPDSYNFVAEKGSMSCMQHSIFVQADAKTVVNNDTLQESGTLSGTVRLKPGDDNSSAVILILGTNVYTVPYDTSGNFVTPLLPKGNYTIQIFTTKTGYAVFDTNVTILEGADTKFEVTIPSFNAPSIAKLYATYDSATMFVSLSWSMPDTSKIVSYAFYRKSGLGRDTMWMLDKSALSCTDDVVGFDGDSVSYEIAGIGKNYKEGHRTATQAIAVCGKVYCIKKIDLTAVAAGLSHISDVSVFSDRENEIFLVGAEGIYKMDSNGVVQKDYMIDKSDINDITLLSGDLQTDNAGHLYVRKNDPGYSTVLKFDRDLNVLAQFPLEASVPWSIVVTGNGMIYAFDEVSITYTEVKVYDSAAALIDTFAILGNRVVSTDHFGDTIFTYEYHPDQISAKDKPYIHFYDTTFRQLSVFKAVDFSTSDYCTPRVCSSLENSRFLAVPNGVFVFIAPATIQYGESSLLLFTNSTGKFLARTMVPEYWNRNIYFNASGNMYFVTYQYSDAEDVSDNPMKTLFIYTLEPLFKTKTQ
jgi:hypothetical protein